MTQPRKLVTREQLIQPRTISLVELRGKLKPLIVNYKWADDAINDLWKMGSPDPRFNMCPQVREGTGRPCPERDCPHVRRLLLPTQFAKWWQDVRTRQGLELTAAQALARRARRVH